MIVGSDVHISPPADGQAEQIPLAHGCPDRGGVENRKHLLEHCRGGVPVPPAEIASLAGLGVRLAMTKIPFCGGVAAAGGRGGSKSRK